jgi:hypothetical protein
MALWDTYLVDGVDLSSVARIVEVWDGSLVQGAARGANLVVPGRPGEVYAGKGRDVPTIALGLAVLTCDPATGIAPDDDAGRVAQLNANVRALVRLLTARTERPLALTRRVSFPAGDETHTAYGELARPLTAAMIGAAQGFRVVVELRILDGVWHATVDSAQTLTTGSHTVTSLGDTRTARIMADFSAPAVLANASLGISMRASAAATVDVENLAADFGSVTGLFALQPGANTVTVSAGTVDLTWREAYL